MDDVAVVEEKEEVVPLVLVLPLLPEDVSLGRVEPSAATWKDHARARLSFEPPADEGRLLSVLDEVASLTSTGSAVMLMLRCFTGRSAGV